MERGVAQATGSRDRRSGPPDPIPWKRWPTTRRTGIDPDIAFGTVGHIATTLFKSPEMQTFYMRAIQTSTGFFPQDRPGPYWHIHALGLILSMDAAAIVTGGTHSITHALLRAFEEYGGEFFVLSEVKRVLVDNNKAYGIELTDGDRILADIVVSDLNTELTMDVAGKESWPEGDLGERSEAQGKAAHSGRQRL